MSRKGGNQCCFTSRQLHCQVQCSCKHMWAWARIADYCKIKKQQQPQIFQRNQVNASLWQWLVTLPSCESSLVGCFCWRGTTPHCNGNHNSNSNSSTGRSPTDRTTNPNHLADAPFCFTGRTFANWPQRGAALNGKKHWTFPVCGSAGTFLQLSLHQQDCKL